MAWLLIGAVAAGLLVIGALRAVGAPVMSPGVVGVAFYILMGGFGAIAAAHSGFVDEGAAHYVLAYATRPGTLMVFTGVAAAFGAGAFMSQLILRHTGSALPDLQTVRAGLTGRPVGPAVFLAASLPLLLEIVGLGPALLHASAYLQSDGPSAAFKVGGTLAPIGFLAAAYLALQKTQHHRLIGRLLCLCYAVVAFSTATRALGMLAVLWLLTVEGLGEGGRWPRRALRLVWVLALTYVGFSAAIIDRGLSVHGLVPYVQYYSHHLGDVWVAPNEVVGNLLFGYPLTSYVVNVAPQVSQHAIATSLNPLPGSLTDWATVSETLRAHPFIPYNTIGELFSYSAAVAVVYFAIAGFLLQHAAATLLRNASDRVRLGVALGVLAAAAFFMVTSLQYNTRTVSRTLWLMLGLVVLAGAWRTVQVLRARVRPATRRPLPASVSAVR